MATACAGLRGDSQLRNEMADSFELPPGPVDQAMRTVPRHLFVPRLPLQDAYENDIVVTHREADGSVLSCSTLPSCMAGMLAQLDVQPGHRVLEIGAGTGYNAALLAQLAGPAGHVTTIDIDPGVVSEARQHLTAAGFGSVRVVCDDGALGYAPDAPYDRIIVTAGAWDIPPPWTNQAASDARMVLPLRINGFTHEVTLERAAGAPGSMLWHSTSHHLSGFIPMRGSRNHREHDVPIVSSGKAELRLEADVLVDPAALRQATSQPPVLTWTGTNVTDLRLPGLEFWLASVGGLCRLICRKPGHGLAPAIGEGGSLAVTTRDSFAYLTVDHAASGPEYDVGIYAYGPQAGPLTARAVGRVRAWAAEHRDVATQIEIHQGIATTRLPDILLNVAKQHTRVIVRAVPSSQETTPLRLRKKDQQATLIT